MAGLFVENDAVSNLMSPERNSYRIRFDEIVAVDDCSWMSFCFLQVLSSAVQVVVGVENAFQIRGRLMTDFPA